MIVPATWKYLDDVWNFGYFLQPSESLLYSLENDNIPPVYKHYKYGDTLRRDNIPLKVVQSSWLSTFKLKQIRVFRRYYTSLQLNGLWISKQSKLEVWKRSDILGLSDILLSKCGLRVAQARNSFSKSILNCIDV